MVPSADRFANPRLNEETFMMSNIVPQTGALNQFPWNELEMYIRSLARKRQDIYQIAGCYGDAGRLKHKITVPTNCWKIAMIVPRGKKPEQGDKNTQIIAVDMPNIEGIENEKWQKYRTAIPEIEQRTGLKLSN
jgi:endonuclease G